MGPKVTVDSATLMNKGLELIEASWLFDMQPDQIDVIVHPQSIVHSLVEYADGSLIAQLGPHDMRLPIQYALTWPEHIPGLSSAIDLALLARLEFYSPDNATFPAIDICREAARLGSTYPTVLSAADDIAVEAFLEQRLAFVEIVPFVQRVLDAHAPSPGSLTLEAIFAADDWARSFAANLLRDRTSAAS
jgi:1-deoxy-D-xylulose-5-phosphate reductoisomerase